MRDIVLPTCIATAAFFILGLLGCDDKSATTPPEAKAPDPNKQTQMVVGFQMGQRVWVTSNGTKYRVLGVGQLYFTGDKQRMLTVKYLSKDPRDEAVRETEFKDMYALTARNLDLTGYDLVGLEAVDKPPISFGVQKTTSHWDKKTVEQVKELAKQAENGN